MRERILKEKKTRGESFIHLLVGERKFILSKYLLSPPFRINMEAGQSTVWFMLAKTGPQMRVVTGELFGRGCPWELRLVGKGDQLNVVG